MGGLVSDRRREGERERATGALPQTEEEKNARNSLFSFSYKYTWKNTPLGVGSPIGRERGGKAEG